MEIFGLGFIFLAFIGIALLVVAAKTIKIVPQSSVLLIERLGRFHRVAQSGLNIIVPFFEAPRAVFWTNTRPGITSIDLREQYIDLPPQPVITRDNVTINVDSVVYWQITDPAKSVYEVNDLVGGIVQLTITGMRAVMGEMDLDHTLSNRDQINSKLRLILDEATDKWGVKVTRVDVKNINPPEDVRITMEKQMTAERNRRALILEAEGDKQAEITRAEGEKQAAITRSEGEKQSAILQAEGAAQARLRCGIAESEAIAQIAKIDRKSGRHCTIFDHCRDTSNLCAICRVRTIQKSYLCRLKRRVCFRALAHLRKFLPKPAKSDDDKKLNSPESPRELNQ